ncbi:MAG: hypothetical protein JXB47_01705 [Anaerolineae bacterium]|nr:hypothetical protein [Anaerolineae bacterium]
MVARRRQAEFIDDLRENWKLVDDMGGLTGKTLPVEVLQAFVNSMLDLMLWGGPQTVITLAEEHFPGEIGKTLTGEQNPFWPYYHHHFGERAPLDYAFTATLGHGLIKFYGPRGGAGLLLRTGYIWWAGPRPEFCVPRSMFDMVKSHQPAPRDEPQTDSLRKFLAPSILAELCQYFPSACDDTLGSLPDSKYAIAFGAFADALADETGIVSRLSHVDDGFAIEFPECPFCLNELDECRVWWGVLQGCYEWLFGAEPDVSPVDESQSTAHRVVISIK